MLREQASRFKIWLLDYCLTSNHVHLLIDAEDRLEVSQLMRNLAGEFGCHSCFFFCRSYSSRTDLVSSNHSSNARRSFTCSGLGENHEQTSRALSGSNAALSHDRASWIPRYCLRAAKKAPKCRVLGDTE
jgi:REP element-mobilizing transposase RayT